MSYTIATLEDINNNLTINFDSIGNKYLIGIYNKDTKEYTHKTYSTLQEAYTIFERLTKVIIEGCYSYEDRLKML